MAQKLVRQSNATVFTASLKKNNVALATLAGAAKITFQLRQSNNPSAVAALSEIGTPTSTKLKIDTPLTGDVEVSADSSDTNIAPDVYDMAVEVETSGTDKVEFVIEKAVKILPQQIT